MGRRRMQRFPNKSRSPGRVKKPQTISDSMERRNERLIILVLVLQMVDDLVRLPLVQTDRVRPHDGVRETVLQEGQLDPTAAPETEGLHIQCDRADRELGEGCI